MNGSIARNVLVGQLTEAGLWCSSCNVARELGADPESATCPQCHRRAFVRGPDAAPSPTPPPTTYRVTFPTWSFLIHFAEGKVEMVEDRRANDLIGKTMAEVRDYCASLAHNTQAVTWSLASES